MLGSILNMLCSPSRMSMCIRLLYMNICYFYFFVCTYWVRTYSSIVPIIHCFKNRFSYEVSFFCVYTTMCENEILWNVGDSPLNLGDSPFGELLNFFVEVSAQNYFILSLCPYHAYVIKFPKYS